jgi:hypothetical protein
LAQLERRVEFHEEGAEKQEPRGASLRERRRWACGSGNARILRLAEWIQIISAIQSSGISSYAFFSSFIMNLLALIEWRPLPLVLENARL